MTLQLGDIVLDRYALIAPLRSEAGLQAWHASDRMLARDCQLFIVSDKRYLHDVNALASQLVLNRSRLFTPVLQLQHYGQVAVIITELDHGIALSDYLASVRKGLAPLSNRAIGCIVSQAANAISNAINHGMVHQAISTDTVRLTRQGIELADTPLSPLLIDDTQTEAKQENLNDSAHIEQRAIRQIATLLYCLITRQDSQRRQDFSADVLDEQIPAEFRMICKRTLIQPSANQEHAIVPMASLAELIALLGSQTTFAALNADDILLTTHMGTPSIAYVPLSDADETSLLTIPDGIAQNEDALNAQLEQQIEPVDAISSDSDHHFATAVGASNAGSLPAGAGSSLEHAKKTLSALLKRPHKTDASETSANTTSDTTNIDIDFHDIAAAEMAHILAPAQFDLDDSLFPALSRSAEDTALSDTHHENNHKTELVTHPHALSDTTHPQEAATGRVPVVNIHGHDMITDEESTRMLHDEQVYDEINTISHDVCASAPLSLPPSFEPRNLKKQRSSTLHELNRKPASTHTIADAKIFGGLSTKVIALGAVSLLLIVGLVVALHSLFDSHDTGASFANSDSWDLEHINNVPFGSQGVLPQEQPHKQPKIAPRKVSTVPKPSIPTNTTAYEMDRQQFLTRPNQQPGYGYYMHLTQPQRASRFVISIRSAGGRGYLIANTKNDPNKGDRVAEFSFDESGTTDVKFTHAVTAEDFMLWVPLDSLPSNSLYINSVKIY